MIYHVPQMMKKHGSLRRFSGQGIFINLYEQVHGTREIESPALPWHTIQMNTYFPKSWFSKLWLLKQKLSPHNTIPIPFWWVCILSFILRWRDEKWWPPSVFSPKEHRWVAVTNLLLAEKRQIELRGQEWVKRGYEKKGMKRSKWEEFERHNRFKLTRNP